MRFVVMVLVTSLLLAGCSAAPRTDAGADDVEPLPSVEDKGPGAVPPAANDAPENEPEPAGSEPGDATEDEGASTEETTEVEPVMDSCQFRYQNDIGHSECVVQSAGPEYTWLTLSLTSNGQTPLAQRAELRVRDADGDSIHTASINPDLSGKVVVDVSQILSKSYEFTVYSYGEGVDVDVELVVYQAADALWDQVGTWSGGDWIFECKTSMQGYAGYNAIAVRESPCTPLVPQGSFTAVTVEAVGILLEGAAVELSVEVKDAATWQRAWFAVDEDGAGAMTLSSDEWSLTDIVVKPGGGYWVGSIVYDVRITFHAA